MEEIKDEMLERVTLTERAAQRLRSVKTERDGDYIRASVAGGGCSGMSYALGWDDSVGEFDKVFSMHGVELVVDLKSLLYLRGTEIDFSSDLLSGGFVFKNPNAKRTCGCGTSFSA